MSPTQTRTRTRTRPESQTSVTIPQIKPKEFHMVCEVLPPLSERGLDALAIDIKANGLQHPIVTAGGKILDGRNRYLACRKAGIEPKYVAFTGKDLVAFVIRENLLRRHMTQAQRAISAAELRTLIGMYGGVAASEEVTNEEAASYMLVSTASVARASTLFQHGIPALVAGVKSGEFPLDPSCIVAKLPKKEQAELVNGGKFAIIRKAKQLRPANGKAAAVSPETPVETEEGSEPEPIGIFVGGSDRDLMAEFKAAMSKIRPTDLEYIKGLQKDVATAVDFIVHRAGRILEKCSTIERVEVDDLGYLELFPQESNDSDD